VQAGAGRSAQLTRVRDVVIDVDARACDARSRRRGDDVRERAGPGAIPVARQGQTFRCGGVQHGQDVTRARAGRRVLRWAVPCSAEARSVSMQEFHPRVVRSRSRLPGGRRTGTRTPAPVRPLSASTGKPCTAAGWSSGRSWVAPGSTGETHVGRPSGRGEPARRPVVFWCSCSPERGVLPETAVRFGCHHRPESGLQASTPSRLLAARAARGGEPVERRGASLRWRSVLRSTLGVAEGYSCAVTPRRKRRSRLTSSGRADGQRRSNDRNPRLRLGPCSGTSVRLVDHPPSLHVSSGEE
jgi:hypothetical protein